MIESIPCFDCDGKYFVHLKPYETTDGKGDRLIIVNVPHHICDKCGDIILSSSADAMIDDCRIKAGVIYRPVPRRLDKDGNPIPR